MLSQTILLLVAGALHSLGYPTKYFEAIPLASIVAMAYWLFCINSNKQSLKKVLLQTLAFCIGHNICGYYWIGETLHVFGDMPRVLSYLLSSLFSFLTLFHLWPIALCVFFMRKSQIFSPLLFAIFATTIEWITPQQFSTYLGQNALVMAPYLGLAPIFGLHIFSFFSYWLSALIPSWKSQSKRNQAVFSISIIVFLICNIALKLSYSPKTSLNIRLVQASVDNKTKLESEAFNASSTRRVLAKYSSLSIKSSAVFEKPELIVWPETAYPYLLNFNDMKKDSTVSIPESIKNVIMNSKSYVLTGGYDQDSRVLMDPREYNSTFLFNPLSQVSQVYHKRKLIPFGETLPFGYLNKTLKPYLQNIAFFSEGNKWTKFDLKNHSFITPICYEILSPDFIRKYLNNAPGTDFILNLTNDSWYGDTAEPFQHLFLAKWRAIEFQKPLVRSTNNGITSITYPDGSESERLTYNEIKNLDIKLGLADQTTTLYQRYGFALQTLLHLFFLFFIFIDFKLSQRAFKES